MFLIFLSDLHVVTLTLGFHYRKKELFQYKKNSR